MPTYRYAGYPSAKLYDDDRKTQTHHLLWGDWIRLEGAEDDGWVPVRARGTNGWMRAEDLQEERLLEIVFVDVGQGDGALVVTPKDKHLVIDAGEGDNMYRYLRWRYNEFKNTWHFEAAVITHPDQDHYYGFKKLFEEPNVHFGTIYHNGIMEERDEPLGPSAMSGGVKYLTGIAENKQHLEDFLADEPRWRHPTKPQYDKRYPTLLNAALTNGRVGDVRMLSVNQSQRHGDRGYLPGYGPGRELSIEVLGPVDEPDANGKTRLRWFRDRPDGGSYDVGKTKNGHSVILRLQYRDVSLLLGGDLNTSAEMFILQHYAGIDEPPSSAVDEQQLAEGARVMLESDIAKCCHHGSDDFSDAFLRAVISVGTIISSGDQESHAHPRCDTLGAIGLYGRGWRPLIMSTELMRSTREREPEALAVRIGRLREMRDRETDPEKLKQANDLLDQVSNELLKRNVTVYGAINLRTDGRRAVLAYMLEQPKRKKRWDIYRLETRGNGPLGYVKG